MKQTTISYTIHYAKETLWQALIQLSKQENSLFSYEGRNDALFSMDFQIHAGGTLRALLCDEQEDTCKLQLTITAENCAAAEEQFLSFLADRLESGTSSCVNTPKEERQKMMKKLSQKERWQGKNKVAFYLKLSSILFLIIGFFVSLEQAMVTSSYFGILQQKIDFFIFTKVMLLFIFAALLLQGLAQIILLLDIIIHQREQA